jgi:hypothetical protein
VCGRKYWAYPGVVAFVGDSEPIECITKVATGMNMWQTGASCADSGAEKVRRLEGGHDGRVICSRRQSPNRHANRW